MADPRRELASNDAIVTVFRSRLNPNSTGEYARFAEQTEAAARNMAGFVEFKTFLADDGERLSLVIFDSLQAHNAWRDEPLHQRAQAAGRKLLYLDYEILICQLMAIREHHLDLES